MPNIDALDQAMTFIVDHPEQHRQRVWVCETGACLAGHATLLNGYRAVTEFDGLVVEIGSQADRDVTALCAGAVRPDYFKLLDAGAKKVRDVADGILGLEYADANVLFGGANTVDKLRLMVKDLSNGEALRGLWFATDEDEWGNSIFERRGVTDA